MATFTGADKAIGFLFDMVRNIADDYDETSTYAVNDYVIYQGTLYKCTSAINVAEEFTPSHWFAVLIMDEIGAGGGGGGSTTLAGLSDVSIASAVNGDVLTYDAQNNNWKNAAVPKSYKYTVAFQNTDFSVPSGTANVINTYQLSESLDDFDAILVEAYLYVTSTSKNNMMTMFIHKDSYYSTSVDKEWDFLMFADNFSGTTQGRRRIAFGFPSSTSIKVVAQRITAYECPRLNRVIGFNF